MTGLPGNHDGAHDYQQEGLLPAASKGWEPSLGQL
jgi:hypothetical protein